MNINILQQIDGARQAKGVTVIIDVFRAFSVEAYVMNNNAKTIFPVAEVQTAFDLKQNDDVVLIGERHGIKIEGFDFGNSPTDIENVDFSGKVVVHTTSAGTQGIASAANADEILTGALVNAKAISRYILSKSPQEVSLVPMGRDGKTPTDEDTLCAEYIKSLLENKPTPDIKERINNLKFTEGKKFFDETLHDIFPERDFWLSTDVDKFNFVLKVEKTAEGLNKIVKIDV